MSLAFRYVRMMLMKSEIRFSVCRHRNRSTPNKNPCYVLQSTGGSHYRLGTVLGTDLILTW